jgi:hypothetical protein
MSWGSDMEVDASSIAALCVLLAALCVAGSARRRAARRREEDRQRALARRRNVPVVSANVRGLPPAATDLWAEEGEAARRQDRRRT